MTFLADLADSGLSLPEGATQAILTLEEIERLRRQVAVALLIAEWPRRLGGEATSEELAIDKRRARRVAHALSGSLAAWQPKWQLRVLPEGDALRRQAAILDWEPWGAEQQEYLDYRKRLYATWGLDQEDAKDEVWAKQAVVRTINEQRWIAYALR